MDFRIADTFTDSLARLTGDEQKAVKTTAFDLQLNPVNPGMSLHKLDKARDKNFWSVRVNADIRIIVHKTAGSLLLCYVNHHDKAYEWAERRRLETHPTTGAAQIVEIREMVKEVVVPVYVPQELPFSPQPKERLFSKVSRETLLGYGVPAEWLDDVLAATEDSYLQLAERLPMEAAEALLELATGGTPAKKAVAKAGQPNPFDHPDAQRRFRTLNNVEELALALEWPWDKWTIFLHPDQRQWVEKSYTGPARVAGSAGTGKTIVALHRAVHLARTNEEARVLLATFSEPLARALRVRLNRLISHEPRLAERIDVEALDALGLRLHRLHFGPARPADREAVVAALRKASAAVANHGFALAFLMAEWEQVVDAWQLKGWEAYRDVGRLGRKTRLPEAKRRVLWEIFERALGDLEGQGLSTSAAIFTRLAERMREQGKPPYDHAIVDEAQDLTVAHLRFFAAVGAGRSNALFFAGDQGQRIFQQAFSWLSLGVDVRGRSRTLRVNYRTSHQIRVQADRLLEPAVADADGNPEDRRAVSVFNGPAPTVATFPTEEAEIAAVAEWLQDRLTEGVPPHEIGIFVRSMDQIERARAAVESTGVTTVLLDDGLDSQTGRIGIGTMHTAKGLEFRAVAVMACDDEVLPSQARISAVGEDSDLKEVYDTERHLLYVACTRARDALLVTGVEPASEFLEDLTAE